MPEEKGDTLEMETSGEDITITVTEIKIKIGRLVLETNDADNAPQVGVRMTEDHTQAYVNNVCRGSGTLYITEKDIVWINSYGEGFILKYLNISIFAVSTDHDKYPDSCVFMLVQDEESSDGMECDSDFDEDYPSESEIRFVPSGGTSVFDLFNCIQDCNRLHSLDNESSSDDIEDEESQSDDSSHYETNEWTNSNSFLNGNLHESTS